jgi:enoyl-CoA hydratase
MKDAAIEMAESICENAPLAVREALSIVNREIAGDEDDMWTHSDAAHARLLASRDLIEGIGAFFERRQPMWSGE